MWVEGMGWGGTAKAWYMDFEWTIYDSENPFVIYGFSFASLGALNVCDMHRLTL